MLSLTHIITHVQAGSSLGMHPANERHCYNVTSSLIGWTHTLTDPCSWNACPWSCDEVEAKSALQRMGSTPDFSHPHWNQASRTTSTLEKHSRSAHQANRVCVTLPAVAQQESQNLYASIARSLCTCMNILKVDGWLGCYDMTSYPLWLFSYVKSHWYDLGCFTWSCTICPKIYARRSCFVMFCCG